MGFPLYYDFDAYLFVGYHDFLPFRHSEPDQHRHMSGLPADAYHLVIREIPEEELNYISRTNMKKVYPLFFAIA